MTKSVQARAYAKMLVVFRLTMDIGNHERLSRMSTNAVACISGLEQSFKDASVILMYLYNL